MPDEMSPLAQKALAQKAAREKAAADAEANITGAKTRRQAMADVWTVVCVNYAATAEAINKELANTGTSVRLDTTDNPPPHLVGSLTATVIRADAPSDKQTHHVEMGSSGRVSFKDYLAPGERPEEHAFDGENADPSWAQPTLRAFVERALS